MNKENLAKSLFHGPEKYNCAQAVLAAFRDEFGVTEEQIAACKAAGGGRAEGGICGAAYAVKLLISDPELHKTIDHAFIKEGGATACRAIKKNGQLPCRECVGLAARLVEARRAY